MALTVAEQRLVDCIREGTECKFSVWEQIDAQLIRKLMLGVPLVSGEAAVPTPCGVRISGAEIIGRINLDNGRGSAGSVMPGLVLDDCIIADGIDISYAQLGKLSIERTRISELRAVRSVIQGQIVANDIAPVTPEGYCFVSLHSAQIDGDVQFRRAVLREPPDQDRNQSEQYAMDLRSANINGTVYMRNMDCLGTINLSMATIEGHVSLRSTYIDPRPENRSALIAGNCIIRGNLTLRAYDGVPFQAMGDIRLARSNIGAILLDGAVITPRFIDGEGLYLKGCRINGRLYFRDGFRNTSFTDLTAVTVGLDLDAHGAAFIFGVNAAGLKVNGECDLSRVITNDALVDMQDAVIGRTLKTGDIRANIDLRRAQAKTYDDGGQCEGLQMIKLDGFIYERLEHPVRYGDILKTDKERIKWIARQGQGYQYRSGLASWLRQKIWGSPRLKVALGDYRPQPLVQLSRVLREQGLDSEARQILRAKQWIEARHIKALWPTSGLAWFAPLRWIMKLFGLLFGFGYSSGRATAVLAGYFLIGWALATYAMQSELLSYDTRPVTVYARPSAHSPSARSPSVVVPVIPDLNAKGFDAQSLVCNDIGAAYYALDLMVPLIDLHVEDQCKINDKANRTILQTDLTFDPVNTFMERSRLPAYFSPGQIRLNLSDLARFVHTIYAMLGWILVSLAILTFSGLLRYRDRMD